MLVTQAKPPLPTGLLRYRGGPEPACQQAWHMRLATSGTLVFLSTVNAVEFQSVSKSYAIYDAPGDRLKELLSLNRLKRHKDFWAVLDVSFQVRRGETFCIVGENGSGKSTLLQMVDGILHPTSGTVNISGRVSALLELGAGFNPE